MPLDLGRTSYAQLASRKLIFTVARFIQYYLPPLPCLARLLIDASEERVPTKLVTVTAYSSAHPSVRGSHAHTQRFASATGSVLPSNLLVPQPIQLTFWASLTPAICPVKGPATVETVAGPFTGHTNPVWSVEFSPDGQHIVSGSGDGTIHASNFTRRKTETTDDVDFTDHFMINDEGWICGSKGELLMWIPSVHRRYLHRPSTIWISGKRGTSLNVSNFVHGCSWAACIDT